MGVIFIVLGRFGVLDLVARGFPRALIRGVQLTVGLLFLKIAWGLVTDPPKSFQEHAVGSEWALPLALLVLVAAFATAALADHAGARRHRGRDHGRARR